MASKNLQELVIRRQDSLLAAMRCITDNRREVALVVDDGGRLAGVITDGDIRRGLLAGLGTDTAAEKVMTSEYTAVGLESDRAAVLDLMKARSIRHVPVVDADRRLLGIHFLQDLISPIDRPNAAVIMAGGQGVRLRPLTEHIPKPMVRVAGRPILERIVLHLVGHGIRQVYLAVNYKAEMIEEYFGDGSRFGCAISYLHETQPLGTGGPLSLLPQPLRDPVIVMNGDLVTQVDVSELLDFHAAHNVVATVAARPYEVEIPFGVIREDAGRLVGIEEKPSTYHLINSGVYVLGRDAVDRVPKGTFFPITCLFEKLLEQRAAVGVYTLKGDWTDVGRHEELRRARGES